VGVCPRSPASGAKEEWEVEIAGLPEELAQYLNLCFESVKRATERRGRTSHPFPTSAHTTETYALRTALRR
jgi:hypothetical protein